MTLTDFEWVYGAEPGPDGRVVWISDATGRPQPWLDGRCLPVPGSVRRCVWRPDGARLLVLTDPDGGEDHRLGELDPATGEVRWLVAEPGVRCEIGVPYGGTGDPYNANGTLLAYASNARDHEVFDVLVRDANGSRIVLRGDDRYLPLGFSPDSRVLLVLKLHQNTDHELFAVDLATDTVRQLTRFDGPAKYEPVAWLPDSSGIYLCTTQGRDFTGLATLSLDGELTWLDTPESDVEGGALSRDGTRIAWGRNEDGYTRLLWAEIGGNPRELRGEPREVTGLPRGLAICEFGYGGHALHFTHSGELLVQLAQGNAATELYLADLDAGTAKRLTDFGAGLPDDLVAPTVVHATSADGLRVPCLLYRPPSASADDPVPVVMTVHGGPESQAYPEYYPMVQSLLAHGIGVIAPNFRGSSGYGLRYQRTVYRDWGGGDLEDLAATAALLEDVDWADGTRLGVHGASYGGFAALSCVTRLPHLWRAAVSECGTSDLLSDIRNGPPTWRRRTAEWIGDPDDPADRARLVERSPLGHAHRVQAPVLLMHGENDTRVDPEESEQMYRRLRELGKPVRLELHPGIGHEINREGLADTVEMIVGWFTTNL
ncbi:dipeptidyl aminopeptidase/acylaminoacyl peptidase [Saccharothrix tamanrassetensis]|uniref:Dipeptidyl aminopeptidase/acylaminoacyl peptidase n=1 Tax=Saccharothrix tamanrassetensis TaxID=1051531 RepID=A0A841CV02_9PSEU|nr:alpha/beta fold hydrolase [Saccharothrix tamanrassetensis]MBB5960144.1 dipeptidyl aminopeptidase/acylaminoacyl peptidase [Saccharothrix tamanrassetensis]